MWNSYAKQQGMKIRQVSCHYSIYLETNEPEESDQSRMIFFPIPPSTVVIEEPINDPIQTVIDEHKQQVGFYRMTPNRPLLIPHKISMNNIFGDQSHIVIDQTVPQLTSFPTNTMNLLDLNHNQHHLNEVESVQLLSSLIIRAVQVHKQHEKFIPVPSSSNFTNVLNVSQMHLHSPSNFNSPLKLPPILHERPTPRQLALILSDVQTKATNAGQCLSNSCLALYEKGRERETVARNEATRDDGLTDIVNTRELRDRVLARAQKFNFCQALVVEI
jgi:hypothetical protein